MNKTKQYVFSAIVFVVAFLVSHAAYAVSVAQDITLKTTNNNDITMLANSEFDSMTVGASSFTFTLSGSQTVTLRDSDAQILKTNVDGVQGSCDGSTSSVTLQASKASSFQISIEGFACSTGGGGGGGGSTSSTQTTTTTTTTTTATSATSAPTTQTTPSPYLEGAPAPVAPLSGGMVASAPVLMPTVAFPGVLQITQRLSVGSTGEDVRALQEALASMLDVYPEGTVSGYFGDLTKAAVAKFQMKYGIVSSSSDAGYGSVGPMTRAKLMEVFGSGMVASTQAPLVSAVGVVLARELGLGASGDDVTQLQAFLAADSLLYPEGKITGYYGSLTVAAVRRFQERYGIAQVGRVGPQTLLKLNEVMGQNMGVPSAPSALQGDEAAKAGLQNQITDLQALIESLTKQIQSAR